MNEAIKTIVKWLKKPRTGWIIRGIWEKAETVLQHTKKVVRAAKIYGKHIPWIDYEKFLKMALYHDFAEHKEKDYTPWEISKDEKYRRERSVMETIRDFYGFPNWQEIHDLWIEFEARETLEAKLLFQLDKLDAAIQALEYEKEGYSSVTDFYPDTLQKLSDPTLKHIFEILLRKEFSHKSFYEQYFLLLELNGDEVKYYQTMKC